MKKRNLRVLIVEDEDILRTAYSKILSHEGYEVTEASNGKKALSLLAGHRPDLILLDILMPEMDGLEFLMTANLPKAYPHVKVIAFSNLSNQQKLDQMMKLGVVQNILKSNLSPKQLAHTVKLALG